MKTQNMTEGKPSSLIFKFALPLMAGNLCQEFYTIADAVIVGQFLGVKALAAVGIGGWITWMMTAAIQGFSQGFSVPVAQAFGAEDKKHTEEHGQFHSAVSHYGGGFGNTWRGDSEAVTYFTGYAGGNFFNSVVISADLLCRLSHYDGI